jgi:pyroglutamyl-peptidase
VKKPKLGDMTDYTVLVSGFPDSGEANPTGRTAHSLADPSTLQQLRTDTHETVNVIPVIVPLSFSRAWPTLRQQIEEHHPQIVVILGRHRGAHGVNLERCARNRIEASHPDDDGDQPLPQPVRNGGPSAYWTRLPLGRILNAFASHHVPASLASDNGTFVCNALFYRLMDWCASHSDLHTLGGLMALPNYRTLQADSTGNPGHMTVGLNQSQMTAAGEQLIAQTTLFYAQSVQHQPLVPPTRK